MMIDYHLHEFYPIFSIFVWLKSNRANLLIHLIQQKL